MKNVDVYIHQENGFHTLMMVEKGKEPAPEYTKMTGCKVVDDTFTKVDESEWDVIHYMKTEETLREVISGSNQVPDILSEETLVPGEWYL